MSDEQVKFSNQKLDVTWNGRLCIHIAECGRAEGGLFVGGRKPWCQPDLATIDEVMDLVQRCPSGALSFSSEDLSVTDDLAGHP